MSDRDYIYYEQAKKRTEVSDPVTIGVIGGHNELIVQPNIMVQSMTNHEDNLPVMSATGTQSIQIIKLTHDNIKKMRFMGSVDSLVEIIYESFDYANDAGVRAIWATNNAARIQCYNDKAIVATGTSSMRMSATSNNAAGFYIQKALATATDFSSASYNSLVFDFRKNSDLLVIKLQFVDASGSAASTLIGVDSLNTWNKKQFTHDSFIDEQATATDWTKILYIRWVVVSNTATNQAAWVDQMIFNAASVANNLTLKFYDCGAVEPTASSTISSWTQLTSDQGRLTQPVTVSILKSVGHNTLELNDTFGVTYGSTPLTVGNYLAVVAQWAADNLVVAGHYVSGTQPYTNGKCFFSTDSGATLTEQTDTTMRFTLYSVINCTVKGFKLLCDAAPKNSTISFHYDDHCKNLESFLLRKVLSTGTSYDQSNMQLAYDKSNQLIFYVKHDVSSSFTKLYVDLDIEYTKDWE